MDSERRERGQGQEEGQTILWRRLDEPGHDSARLSRRGPGWQMAGSALFAHEGRPCRLDYEVQCDEGWRTQSAHVTGWIGARAIDLQLRADTQRNWWLNGQLAPRVAGCADLDLSFTPATNTLPIRRLALAIGQSAGVRSAWLRLPEGAFEPLPQTYRRVSDDTYRYRALGGAFTGELIVDATGLVTHYDGLWELEALQVEPQHDTA